MGSIGHLNIDGARLLSFRDSVDPTFMLLFTRDDLRRSIVTGRDRPAYGVEPDDEFEVVEFVVTSAIVRDRLGVLGIGSTTVAETFREIVADKLALHARWTAERSWPEDLQR